MRVKALSEGYAVVEGDSGNDYNPSLKSNSCDCRWGLMRLSHPERKPCKHLKLIQGLSLLSG